MEVKLIYATPINIALEAGLICTDSEDKIGNYDSCSYCISGTGTFRGNDNANPFVGEIGKIHLEEEIRIETIFPKHLKNRIIKLFYNDKENPPAKSRGIFFLHL